MCANLAELFIIEDGIWHSKALCSERFKATFNRMKKQHAAFVKHGNMEKAAEVQQQINEFDAAHALHLHSTCTGR